MARHGFRRILNRVAAPAVAKVTISKSSPVYWETKWHALSIHARKLFLSVLTDDPATKSRPPGQAEPPATPVSKDVVDQLVDAGFLEIRETHRQSMTVGVPATEGLSDFAARIHLLGQTHLLSAGHPDGLVTFAHNTRNARNILDALNNVFRTVGIPKVLILAHCLRHLSQGQWPGWVTNVIGDPLAERIVNVVRKAGKPVALTELVNRMKGERPEVVREMVAKLVLHLALLEDLDPATSDLVVGFHPIVRDELVAAEQPRTRPLLIVCQQPKEVCADESVIVNDLRGVLLEVASEPPRIRQNASLFHKENNRFRVLLEPLPAWLVEALGRPDDEARLEQAFAWARAFHLLNDVSEKNEMRRELTDAGKAWLASSLEEQYAWVFGRMSALVSRPDAEEWGHQMMCFALDRHETSAEGDAHFLGEHITARSFTAGTLAPPHWTSKPEDHHLLREFLYRAFSELEPGVFYRLDSVKEHIAWEEMNPLHLGRAAHDVVVYWRSRLVPPLHYERVRTTQYLITRLVTRRLIPLGCLQAAIDDEGRICIARGPRFDVYFGRKVDRLALAPAAEVPTRVVVQPDFSVIVIGMNPAPVAELAPFCERTTRSGGQGAIILKITRESVVKAVGHGITPAEILARLERHATIGVPGNVLRELENWSTRVRHVILSSIDVLRCPDRETADRVVAMFRRSSERLNETLVAFDRAALTSAARNKLREHGILVERTATASEHKKKTKRKVYE